MRVAFRPPREHRSSSGRTAKATRAAIASAAAAIVVLHAAAVHADTAYWDGDGVGPADGGSGIWDGDSPRWATSPAGNTFTPHDPNDGASLGGLGGFVQIGTDAAPAISTSSLAFDAGYTLLAPPVPAAPATLSVGSGTIDTGGYDVTSFAPLAAPAGLAKLGGGTLTLAASSGLDTTPLTVNAGTVALVGGTSLGSIAGPGHIRFDDRLTVGGDDSSTTFAGTLAAHTGARLMKTGLGTLTLSGANTIVAGSITSEAGVLKIANAAAVPAATPVFVNFASGNTGALQTTVATTIGGLGSNSGSNTAAVVTLGGALTVQSSRNISFRGLINGAGDFIKDGPGIQQLQGGISSFSGSIILRGGTLMALNTQSFGNPLNTVTLDGGTLSSFPASTLLNNRAVTITANGGVAQVLQQTLSINQSGFISTIAGGQLTKTGPGSLQFNNDNTNWTGGLVVADGQVNSFALTGSPFGVGPMRLNTGGIILTPSVAGTANLKIASAPGATMQYGPGSRLLLDRNVSSMAVLRIGDEATATASTLSRLANGTLLIVPQSLTQLGNPGSASREEIYVAGGMDMTNGIVSPSIVSQQSQSDGTGDFLTYNANGLVRATYASGDINAAGVSSVFKSFGAQTLSADRRVYALNLSHNASVNLANFALTIGDGGSGAAGLILGTNTTVMGSGTNRVLRFDGTDGVVYVGDSLTSTFSVPVDVVGGGAFVKFGHGRLTLSTASTYVGPTVIAQGVLQTMVANTLPVTTRLRLMGGPGTNSTAAAGNYPKLQLGAAQTVAELAGESSVAVVDLAASTLTVNQATDSTYAGVIGTSVSTLASQGRLVKTGVGTLTLANRYITGFSSIATGTPYSKLTVAGGVVSAAGTPALPIVPAGSFLADAIRLDNNATLRWTGLATATGSVEVATTMNQFAGLTIAANGGTIDVTDPNETLILQSVGVQSIDPANANYNRRNVFGVHDIAGSGALTKSGPGALRLYANAAATDSTGASPAPIANSFTGKTRVVGGTLQFPEDGALGVAPVSLVADQLLLDGGAIESNGPANSLAATRGITIGNAGGEIRAGAAQALSVNAPLAGGGALTKSGDGALSLNAASPGFSGAVSITAGTVHLNAADAAGSGAISIAAASPVTIGKAGAGSVTLSNDVTLAAGAAVTADIPDPAGSLELAGNVAGPNHLFKSGAGTLILSGTTNTHTGGTIVKAGKLALASSLDKTAAVFVMDGASVTMSPATTLVLKTPQLAIAPAGTLDLTNNKLITNVAVGAAVAGIYNGISGEVQRSSNFGAWDQPGLTTSMLDALAGLTSIGVASGAEIRGLGLSDTDIFAGQTITGASTIAMYTYAGDANLDGLISGDDYAAIDFNVAVPGASGWYNGDFNWDGIISGDDYAAIDFNIVAQGAPFPTAALGAIAGANAVPEPTIGAVSALLVASTRRRRRRAR